MNMNTKAKQILEAAAEIAGAVLTCALFLALAWLFLAATPPQNSAECDYWAAQMEGGAK